MLGYPVISADSHMVEPPEMWVERLDKKFRDRAPHTVRGFQGREGEFYVCENVTPVPVAGLFGAGVKPEDLPEHSKKGFESAPAAVRDPAARLKDQDIDGVSAEVIYTSVGMFLYDLEDGEFRDACFRAYNDWAAEYCSYDSRRLIGVGLLPLGSTEAAVKELERIAKKGMKGAMIEAEAPEEKPYSHPDYDPLWAAAQELNIPLSLHLNAGRARSRPNFVTGDVVSQIATMFHQVERSLAQLVLNGVLERFPHLKIISAENGVGWMAHLMWRLDRVYGRFGSLDATKLKLKPSEYIKRQVFSAFLNEPLVLDTLHWYGADNVMWSADYPHAMATWPRSHQFIEETLGKLPEQERRKIVHDTVARVYGVD